MIRELSCDMQPTAALRALRLEQTPARGGVHMLSNVSGGEINLQMTDAPNIPGKVLVAVIERWPHGHIEVLWAAHANTEVEALAMGLPQYKLIQAARKA